MKAILAVVPRILAGLAATVAGGYLTLVAINLVDENLTRTPDSSSKTRRLQPRP
jgi:hypothetical protein